jgi:hypothetical protein
MSAGAPSASDAIGLSRANLVRAIRLPRSGTASGVIPEHWPSRVSLHPSGTDAGDGRTALRAISIRCLSPGYLRFRTDQSGNRQPNRHRSNGPSSRTELSAPRFGSPQPREGQRRAAQSNQLSFPGGGEGSEVPDSSLASGTSNWLRQASSSASVMANVSCGAHSQRPRTRLSCSSRSTGRYTTSQDAPTEAAIQRRAARSSRPRGRSQGRR